MQTFATLAAALDASAQTTGELGFIDGVNDERRLTYDLLRRAALRSLAALQARGLQPGDPLILFIDDNLHFVQFFWAAIYGGLVPIPVAAGGTRAHLDKLDKIWHHMSRPHLIIGAEHLQRIRRHLEDQKREDASQALSEQAISDQTPAVDHQAELASLSPEQTALIQFSSGSTGDPKGVVLTHANLLTNIQAIAEGSQLHSREVALSWMPLTHDMGLIGFHLTPLCRGMTHYLMRTDTFARRPLLWLEKAAEKQANLLCSPNFGYRHSLRAIQTRGLPRLDLSHVRLIYNGAEPISVPLVRDFFAALQPAGLDANSMFCVYGLAEASLAVTFPEAGQGLTSLKLARDQLGIGQIASLTDGPEGVELANLGQPVMGTQLRIVDEQGQPLPESVVGHIHIRGANVTAGYHDNPVANHEALTSDGWLATGDLGFIHQGQLYVTGRAKDIIFVNGANHYPQDLENLACQVDGVMHNKIAAAGVRSPDAEADQLVLFVVFRGHDDDFAPMARAIAQCIYRDAGLAVDHVLPVQQIPKTTSGKLQRALLAQQFADGQFNAQIQARTDLIAAESPQAEAEDSTDEAIADHLQAICNEVAPDKQIGPEDDLFAIGLSSLELAQIHEGIEARWPNRIEINDLFEYPTINDIAALLAQRQQES